MLLAASTNALSDGFAFGLAIIGVVTGGGGIFATMFAYGRVKAVEQTLALLRSENDTLNKVLKDRDDECNRKVSALEGQVKVLTQQNVHATVTAVVAAMRELRQETYATPHNHPKGGHA